MGRQVLVIEIVNIIEIEIATQLERSLERFAAYLRIFASSSRSTVGMVIC